MLTIQQNNAIFLPVRSAKQILKKALWVILLCLLLLSISLPALAVTIQEIPNPRLVYGGWVTDMANILSPETEAQLNKIISEFESKNGTEIAVVTVPDIDPNLTPKQFATNLFKDWKIGKKRINNGVLFLISQAERRVEIKTGYGIEAILPNSKIKEIIEFQIIPLFKLSDYSQGTLVGTQALIKAISQSSNTVVINSPIAVNNITINHQEYTYLFFGLLTAFAIIIGCAIAIALRPLILTPSGSSRVYENTTNAAAKCAECGQPMEKLDLESLIPLLSVPEQTAQKLGSVNFYGWRCSKCYPALSGGMIHIRAYVLDGKNYTNCPTCKELTVERTSRTIQSATETREGQRLVTETCYCCSFYQVTTKTIPKTDSYDSSGSNNGGWDSGGGGGGFGGGDCGGGGDGGSW
jgi:uncharacterized protein